MTVGDAAEDLRPQGSPLSFTAGRFVYIEKKAAVPVGITAFFLSDK